MQFDLKSLPGRGAGFTSIHRMWTGDGYLLLVETSGYREMYKRIEFADIQAIILCRNRWWGVRTGIETLSTLFLLGLGSLVGGDGGIVLAFLAVIPALVLITDLLLGATCTVHLRTPVQQVALQSLRRLRNAHKVIRRLVPLIEQAQGSMAPEELRSRFEEFKPIPKWPQRG